MRSCVILTVLVSLTQDHPRPTKKFTGIVFPCSFHTNVHSIIKLQKRYIIALYADIEDRSGAMPMR